MYKKRTNYRWSFSFQYPYNDYRHWESGLSSRKRDTDPLLSQLLLTDALAKRPVGQGRSSSSSGQ